MDTKGCSEILTVGTWEIIFLDVVFSVMRQQGLNPKGTRRSLPWPDSVVEIASSLSTLARETETVSSVSGPVKRCCGPESAGNSESLVQLKNALDQNSTGGREGW